MDLSVFLLVHSEVEAERTAAVQTIHNASQSPQFIPFLVTFLRSPDLQSNPVLLESVLVIFLSLVRSRAADLAADADFVLLLLQLLLDLPLTFRRYVEEAALLVGLAAETDFSPAVLAVIGAADSPDAIFSTLSLAAHWIKRSPSSVFLANVASAVFPFLSAATEGDAIQIPVAMVIAKLVRLLLNRRHLVLDATFDALIGTFARLLVEATDSSEFQGLKASIVKLFSALIIAVFEKWKSVDEVAGWREHFERDILSGVLESATHLLRLPRSPILSQRLLWLCYNLLRFGLCVDSLLTDDFLLSIVLPAAALTDTDLEEFDENPSLFVAFCHEHKNAGDFLPRICASEFVHLLAHEHLDDYNPLRVLGTTSEGPVEFEAKLFLMERYAAHAPLPDDLFETLFDLLTTEQPLYIVAALLRLIARPLCRNSPPIGVTVAEHFIVNSVCPVVQHAAVYLMLTCINDFPGPLDRLKQIFHVDIAKLSPVLLELSGLLFREEPSVLLEKLFEINNEAFLGVVPELVENFFALWRSNQDIDDDSSRLIVGPSLLHSIRRVLELVPDDADILVTLCPSVLGLLLADITEFSDCGTVDDQFAIAAVFSRKLSAPADSLVEFISSVLSLDLDFSLLVSDFVALVGPLMFAKALPAQPIVDLCLKIVQPDAENLSLCHGLVAASCIIQAFGVEFFPFVTTAGEVLRAKQKSIILIGALYVFAAALFVDAERALAKIRDVEELVVGRIIEESGLAYREAKCALVVLCWLARAGCQDAAPVAVSLVAPLVEVREIDRGASDLAERERAHQENSLLSMTPLIEMPMDEVNEIELFVEVVGDAVPPEVRELIAAVEDG
jgi:hypothetical protein